eukprot:161313-Chlamydomonas_euryale.AAC.1
MLMQRVMQRSRAPDADARRSLLRDILRKLCHHMRKNIPLRSENVIWSVDKTLATSQTSGRAKCAGFFCKSRGMDA